MAKRKISGLPIITASEVADDDQIWIGTDVVDIGLSFRINGTELKKYLAGTGVEVGSASPSADPDSWPSSAGKRTLIFSDDPNGTAELLGVTDDDGSHVVGKRILPISDNPGGIGSDPENPTLTELTLEFLAQGLAIPVAGDIIQYISPTQTYYYDVAYAADGRTLTMIKRSGGSGGSGNGTSMYEEVAEPGNRTPASTVPAGYRSAVSANQVVYVSDGSNYQVDSSFAIGTSADRKAIKDSTFAEAGQVFLDTDIGALFRWDATLVTPNWVQV